MPLWAYFAVVAVDGYLSAILSKYIDQGNTNAILGYYLNSVTMVTIWVVALRSHNRGILYLGALYDLAFHVGYYAALVVMFAEVLTPRQGVGLVFAAIAAWLLSR